MFQDDEVKWVGDWNPAAERARKAEIIDLVSNFF
jgi:hypothetical protein